MLFTFDEKQSNRPAARVFAFFRLAREIVFCRCSSESTFLDIAILSFVKADKAPAMRDIAVALRVSSPAATSVIEKLVDKKYLKRSEDQADRRIVRLAITPKGEKELELGREEALKSVDSMLSVLDGEEQKEFSRLLAKIVSGAPESKR